jgi:hypothetical protein
MSFSRQTEEMRTTTLSFALLFFLTTVSLAQDGVQPVFFFGGGPSFTTNHMKNYVKNGFNFAGGGGVRLGGAMELLGEFQYHELGVQDQVLLDLQVPDGNARVLSVTGNVKFPFGSGRVQPYVIAGGGWYRRTVEFTEPDIGSVTVFDPWWGWIGDVAVPTNRILGSVSRNAGGVNAGGGVSFSVGDRTRVFAQVRWHRAFHNPTNTTIVPITVGISF